LRAHRAIAQEAILQLGWQPVLFMEQQSVATGPSVHACQSIISTCEHLLLIVGHRCGWIPSKEQGGNGVASITEIELATWAARQRRPGQPIRHPLIMMVSDRQRNVADGPEEDDLHRSCQTMFRARLKASGLLIHEFSMPNDPMEMPGAELEFKTLLTMLVSKWKVGEVEQELRKAKSRTWLLSALAFVIGAAIVSPGEETKDADW
jgi:hypothetical protein